VSPLRLCRGALLLHCVCAWVRVCTYVCIVGLVYCERTCELITCVLQSASLAVYAYVCMYVSMSWLCVWLEIHLLLHTQTYIHTRLHKYESPKCLVYTRIQTYSLYTHTHMCTYIPGLEFFLKNHQHQVDTQGFFAAIHKLSRAYICIHAGYRRNSQRRPRDNHSYIHLHTKHTYMHVTYAHVSAAAGVFLHHTNKVRFLHP
jgi:hypothetical protein